MTAGRSPSTRVSRDSKTGCRLREDMLNGTSEFLEAIFQTSKNAAQYDTVCTLQDIHYPSCTFAPQAWSFVVV
jgi:hypothetical protein